MHSFFIFFCTSRHSVQRGPSQWYAYREAEDSHVPFCSDPYPILPHHKSSWKLVSEDVGSNAGPACYNRRMSIRRSLSFAFLVCPAEATMNKTDSRSSSCCFLPQICTSPDRNKNSSSSEFRVSGSFQGRCFTARSVPTCCDETLQAGNAYSAPARCCPTDIDIAVQNPKTSGLGISTGYMNFWLGYSWS